MYKIFQTLILGRPLSLALIGFIVFASSPASADQVHRIASWNIADFHHGIGVEARSKIGTARYPADFKLLQKYASVIDADIITLQEIVTERAARLLFPDKHYWLFMSSRYREDLAAGAEPDIYTAIAVRKSAGIKPIRQSDLAELQIHPAGDNPYERSTRRGTALLLDINGDWVWVMSVHLKSSCPKVKKLSRSRQHACKMLWQQTLSLKRWIDEKIQQRRNFVIGGDFNRRFGRLKDKGEMWTSLSQAELGKPTIIRFPQTQLRRCPTRKGKGVHPIDWFVVNADFAPKFKLDSYFETRWSRAEANKHHNRLSDHCPIHIDFN